MENKCRNVIPKEEDYTIKYVFNEESIIEVNNVIKECFIDRLRTAKKGKIAL